MNPKLKAMQLSNIETVDDEYILLDSGATHALRPARDAEAGRAISSGFLDHPNGWPL
jgi:hypothetical protein